MRKFIMIIMTILSIVLLFLAGWIRHYISVGFPFTNSMFTLAQLQIIQLVLIVVAILVLLYITEQKTSFVYLLVGLVLFVVYVKFYVDKINTNGSDSFGLAFYGWAKMISIYVPFPIYALIKQLVFKK